MNHLTQKMVGCLGVLALCIACSAPALDERIDGVIALVVSSQGQSKDEPPERLRAAMRDTLDRVFKDRRPEDDYSIKEFESDKERRELQALTYSWLQSGSPFPVRLKLTLNDENDLAYYRIKEEGMDILEATPPSNQEESHWVDAFLNPEVKRDALNNKKPRQNKTVPFDKSKGRSGWEYSALIDESNPTGGTSASPYVLLPKNKNKLYVQIPTMRDPREVPLYWFWNDKYWEFSDRGRDLKQEIQPEHMAESHAIATPALSSIMLFDVRGYDKVAYGEALVELTRVEGYPSTRVLNSQTGEWAAFTSLRQISVLRGEIGRRAEVKKLISVTFPDRRLFESTTKPVIAVQYPYHDDINKNLLTLEGSNEVGYFPLNETVPGTWSMTKSKLILEAPRDADEVWIVISTSGDPDADPVRIPVSAEAQ